MTLPMNRRKWIQSLGACSLIGSCKILQADTAEGYTIPTLDVDGWADHQVIVDREPGQYLGHPTTVLLEDGKTILTVYPKGHGKGPIQYKKSTDGGKTWSDRLPTPPAAPFSHVEDKIVTTRLQPPRQRAIRLQRLHEDRQSPQRRSDRCDGLPGVIFLKGIVRQSGHRRKRPHIM